MPYPEIVLKAGKQEALQRFHPWIFSGAIHEIRGNAKAGDVVLVKDKRGNSLATGHFQEGSIAVKMLAFEEIEIDADFWLKKIQAAFQMRSALGLINNPRTNAFRLIHGEGDDLPGLIVDIYAQTAVLQCHSIGMHRASKEIAQAIVQVFGGNIKAVYDKSKETLPFLYATNLENSYIIGEKVLGDCLENGHTFGVNWELGQKTGFFIDQRENRQLLQAFVKNKRVLNAFCYSGGFSVYALQAGAQLVHSVDASQKAIDWTNENVQKNAPNEGQHESFVGDVLQFLKQSQEYEVMIIDPPAFAKNISKRHNAVQGYKRLNALALSKLARGGIMFTFSCSQVIDRDLFQNTIVAAALEANRKVRILQHLSQAPDHPTNAFHPEGSYLKGLVLYAE